MTVDWSLCHWPACIEECRDGPKIDCPAVLAWREKKDDKMTDDNGSVSTIPASAETISMTDHLRLMSAQAARIAELEAALRNPIRSDDGYYDYEQAVIDALLAKDTP